MKNYKYKDIMSKKVNSPMLDKESKNYYYNLGRVVAIVEIMNGLRPDFFQKVSINAYAYLPYHLTKALFNDNHNLHAELLDPADIVLRQGKIPHGLFFGRDKNGEYALGYYHQKAYIDNQNN